MSSKRTRKPNRKYQEVTHDSEDEIPPSKKCKTTKKKTKEKSAEAPSATCITCKGTVDGDSAPFHQCQFCTVKICISCFDKDTDDDPLVKCRCGLFGPGGWKGEVGHMCSGCPGQDTKSDTSQYHQWMEWCANCQERHCFDCVESGCCDSDTEEDFNRHLQASYKKFGKDVVNQEMNDLYHSELGF
ncbi:hypothetical protein TrCOL_g11636 [Triparma columacea]|uniref:Uncharacterized protein n=1 Tax=Triparma columacea TaxID=722753 RepID=A0A9W7LG92_9STRA|nr:hypothetical protein TrCOL_g11636 [Triparma columacea]